MSSRFSFSKLSVVIVVDENAENNIVTSDYVPLLANVNTRYIDNDGNELRSKEA